MTARAPAPPLRFLGAVLGGWVVLRAGALLFWPDAQPSSMAEPAGRESDAEPLIIPRAAGAVKPATLVDAPRTPAPLVNVRNGRAAVPIGASPAAPLLARAAGWQAPAPPSEAVPMPVAPIFAPLSAPPGAAGARRWSVSAWLLLRDDAREPSLAPGGTLGGSQAGARLVWRLGHGLALSARAYAPLRRAAGAEAALGVEWRPAPRVPLALLAERRIGLGREGRDAFALMLHGGGSARLPLSARLDGYAQAGVVGTGSRDLFFDAVARVSVPAGPLDVGGGAWGAAQPGAARLDAGPSVSWRLPAPRANLRLTADWRFRIAGEARPVSGPALTLAADF